MRLGFDEAGTGPVLLLVHGFPLDRTVWAGQIEGLSDIRRVVAVDLRGRGKSPAPASAGWTIDDLADDLAETIEALGAGKVDLAGLSMGGYIAFSLWRRYRDKVGSLLLADTKAEADPDEAKQGREKTAALTREKGTAALLEDLAPKLLSPSASEETKTRLRKIFEDLPGETAAADALAMKDRPDSTSDLATIDVPTLVIHGEQDALMPMEGARGMAEKIRGSKFVTVPDAGHLAPLENPEAVNAALREFLEG